MPKHRKGKTLTGREAAFCLKYVLHWNAALAAKEAGYSARSAKEIGYENLTKPHIQAEIQHLMEDMAMSAQEVLARLTAQGRANMAEIIEPYEVPILDRDGKLVGKRQSFRLKKGALERHGHLIKAIAPTRSGDFKFELLDPQKAHELIGRHRNLFRESHLSIDLTKLTDAQLERIANGEDPLKVVLNA
jgi:hypothetical protein